MDNLMLASMISMIGLTVAFAAVLAFADKKLRVEEDPMVEKVLECLPHVNCGACGCLSCHDYAEKIVKEDEEPTKCPVMGEEAREQLYDLLGAEGGDQYPVIPLIRCAAGCENKKPVADYKGIQTCTAANLAFGAGMECEYGCMGLGDCTNVCPFDALHIEDGLPVLDQEKCTGCGQCAEACPRKIIDMAEKTTDTLYYVACSTHDGPLRVRKICGVGCIGCGICQKLSPKGFFAVEDALSREDLSKQSDQEQEEIKTLAEKCPTKVIKEL